MDCGKCILRTNGQRSLCLRIRDCTGRECSDIRFAYSPYFIDVHVFNYITYMMNVFWLYTRLYWEANIVLVLWASGHKKNNLRSIMEFRLCAHSNVYLVFIGAVLPFLKQ